MEAAHVVIPSAYILSSYDELEHAGTRVRAQAGRWAARRLAAIDYVFRLTDRMPLPSGWDSGPILRVSGAWSPHSWNLSRRPYDESHHGPGGRPAT